MNIGNLNKAYKNEIDEIKIKVVFLNLHYLIFSKSQIYFLYIQSTNKIEKLNDIITEQEINLKEIKERLLNPVIIKCTGINCDFFNNIEVSF